MAVSEISKGARPEVPLHDGAADGVAWVLLGSCRLGHDLATDGVTRLRLSRLGHKLAADRVAGLGVLGLGHFEVLI